MEPSQFPFQEDLFSHAQQTNASGPVFDESTSWSIGCFRFCKGLVTGDFDQDGNVDVFGVYNFNGDRVSFNEGDGTKTCVSLLHYDERPGSTAVADYDRDGDLDLFVAGIEDGVMKVFWYMNNGSRTFEYNPGIEHPAYGLALGDLNGDLYPDIVAGGRGSWSDSAIYLNDQQGGFALAQELPVDTEPWTVELADVDGDDDLDCAIGSEL
ncbi:MAG: VCBS repeat-containing protein [Candidatus Eisenbacteria bacterium]|nr:VCBS repeat-containing protein [Candidatus Eisenbacteria bacterium]